MNVICGIEFLGPARSLLCCGLLALVLTGCADDTVRLMYRSQPEMTRHRRMQAETAARKQAMKRARDKVQAALTEAEAQERTLDELQAALTACLRAGGTYEICYGDQASYLTCLAAGGLDAECRPKR